MRVIAVTGGIATGKSMFCAAARRLEPETAFFDADESVARLYGDEEVRGELRAAFGTRASGPGGTPDRSFLRGLAFGDEGARRKLEAIFHPRVWRDCLASQAMAAKSGVSPLFLAEIPVLFESGMDFEAQVVVVACPPTTQAHRLRQRNGFDDSMVCQVLAAQLPIAEKIRLADWVVWNNGPPEVLRRQTQCLLQPLIYG